MAVDPCSAKDAAAQTRHVGRANRLEQEILCSLLQAPDREHHACEEAKKKQNAKKNVNSFRVWACVSHTRRQQTDLLIVFGTFSEDMMTTGIPFSLDDSCMQMAICNAAQNVSTVLKLPGLKEKDGGGSYLDLLEELVPGHLRHPVVSDDQAHTGLLQQTSEHVSTSHIGTQEKKSKDSVQHCKPRTEPSNSSALFPLSTAVTASSNTGKGSVTKTTKHERRQEAGRSISKRWTWLLTAELGAPEDAGDDGAVDGAVVHREDVRRRRASISAKSKTLAARHHFPPRSPAAKKRRRDERKTAATWYHSSKWFVAWAGGHQAMTALIRLVRARQSPWPWCGYIGVMTESSDGAVTERDRGASAGKPM
jgi:hypothetical protein